MRFSLLLVCSLLVTAAPPFVPADFTVPQKLAAQSFQLVPLTPSRARLDYDAYMSSIAHLQQTFTGNTRWPHDKITMAEAVKDTEDEQARFAARQSFTYAVLTPDGKRELGCIYISPSRKQGFDAMVRLWVTKEQFDAGLEQQLMPHVKSWLAKSWPFQKVAWPKRDISAEAWSALPEKSRD